jgi:hypothetical protein
MRFPVESCSIAELNARLLRLNAFCEIRDLMLVLMTDMMKFLYLDKSVAILCRIGLG